MHSREQQYAFKHAYCFSHTSTAAALRGIVGNSAARGVFTRSHPHTNPDSNTHCDSNACSDRYPNACSDRYPNACSDRYPNACSNVYAHSAS